MLLLIISANYVDNLYHLKMILKCVLTDSLDLSAAFLENQTLSNDEQVYFICNFIAESRCRN